MGGEEHKHHEEGGGEEHKHHEEEGEGEELVHDGDGDEHSGDEEEEVREHVKKKMHSYIYTAYIALN